MSKSKLVSAALATGIAVSGAHAAQNRTADDQAGGKIDVIDAQALSTADHVGVAALEEHLFIVAAADADDIGLFFVPGDDPDAEGGLIDVHVFDFQDSDHHPAGSDDADFRLAQTIYGGDPGDRLSTPGGGNNRLSPQLKPSTGGSAVTVPNSKLRVTPDRTYKKPGRTGTSLNTRKKK